METNVHENTNTNEYYEHLLKSYETCRGQFIDQRQNYEKQYEAYTNVTKELSESQARLNEADIVKVNTNVVVTGDDEKCQSLENELQALRSQIALLEASLGSREEQIKEASCALQQYHEKNDKNEEELVLLRKKSDLLHEDKVSLILCVEQLQRDVRVLKNEYDTEMGSIDEEHEKEMEQVTSRLSEEYAQEIQSLQLVLVAKETERHKLLNDMNEEKKKFLAHNSKLEQLLNERISESHSLRQEMKNLVHFYKKKNEDVNIPKKTAVWMENTPEAVHSESNEYQLTSTDQQEQLALVTQERDQQTLQVHTLEREQLLVYEQTRQNALHEGESILESMREKTMVWVEQCHEKANKTCQQRKHELDNIYEVKLLELEKNYRDALTTETDKIRKHLQMEMMPQEERLYAFKYERKLEEVKSIMKERESLMRKEFLAKLKEEKDLNNQLKVQLNNSNTNERGRFVAENTPSLPKKAEKQAEMKQEENQKSVAMNANHVTSTTTNSIPEVVVVVQSVPQACEQQALASPMVASVVASVVAPVVSTAEPVSKPTVVPTPTLPPPSYTQAVDCNTPSRLSAERQGLVLGNNLGSTLNDSGNVQLELSRSSSNSSGNARTGITKSLSNASSMDMPSHPNSIKDDSNNLSILELHKDIVKPPVIPTPSLFQSITSWFYTLDDNIEETADEVKVSTKYALPEIHLDLHKKADNMKDKTPVHPQQQTDFHLELPTNYYNETAIAPMTPPSQEQTQNAQPSQFNYALPLESTTPE